MLGGEFFNAMALPRHHEHAASSLALVDRLAHESVEAADVAVDPAPAQIRHGFRAQWRLAHQLEAREGLERLHQNIDVDEPCGRAVRQLTALLLLDTQILDLLRMTLSSRDQAFATAVEQDDRIVEVVEQRARRIPTKVRKEQVEALLVDARLEQVAIALPLSRTSSRNAASSSFATDASARATDSLVRSSSRAGQTCAASSLEIDSCVAGSKTRRSSTSSPNHSARQGRARSTPNTSTMPPRTAKSPGTETALSRR